jgi:splicing factor U2AF subunit
MSGELVLPNQAAASSRASTNVTTQSVENVGFTSRVVELKNMLTLGDLESDEEYQDIMEDTKDECSQFGSLKSVIIPRSGPGATKIFLEYLTKEDAAKAIAGLAGRTFDGRKVLAAFFSEEKFAAKDYS